MSTFFFDIDGTLAFQGEIAKGNVEVLKALRAQGHILFICTGRQEYYAASIFDPYVDGYISNNGRRITYQGKCLLEYALSAEEIQSFDDKIYELGGMCVFTGTHDFFVRHNVPSLLPYLESQGNKMVQSTWEKEPVFSFSVCYQPPNTVAVFQEALNDYIVLNDHHNDCTADASTLDFNKGDGIKFVLQELSLNFEDTYAFGDGSNDLCMFEHCAHTIAMGNAVEALKEQAEMVSSHFQEGGILDALKAYQIL